MSDRWICRIVCVALMLGRASAGKTDDGYVTGLSGAMRLMHGHPSIRMVSEEVHIRLPEGKVFAHFVFKNEGPATTVEIGFPETGKDVLPHPRTHMVDFQSTVDGHSVRVTRRVAIKPTDEGDYEYAYWWVKKVAFARGQTRIIDNQYRGGVQVYSKGIYESGFNYVLKTGASWHGPIGRARIVCDLGSVANNGPIKFLPTGGRRDGRIITWDLHNFKPKDDVWVGWYLGFGDISINGHWLWDTSGGESGVGGPGWKAPSENYAADPIPPFKRGQEVWVPVRVMAQWLDARLEGEPKTGAVTLTRYGRRAHFTVGRATLEAEQGALTLPGSIFVREGLIFVPLQASVKAFGGEAHFSSSGRLLITLPKTTDKTP